MPTYHIVGIDPGLVHTGMVRLSLGEGELTHSHALINGLDARAAAAWVKSHPEKPDRIFIEKYDPRLNFSSDERMVKAESLFKQAMHSARLVDVEFIKNNGIKRAVPLTVLDLMGLWNFSTVSHHQDLRSAARIAVFGMMKNPLLNTELADMMRDTLDGSPWRVTDLGGGVPVASVAD